LRLTDIVEHAYVRCLFAALASPQVVPIDQLRVSRAGNPFGFRVLGRFFTLPTFGYYLRYAFAAAQVDFSTVDTVVELGSGAGRQAEVLASLHPDLAIVQLDLAPQLYVAERYLTAALPDRVVPYRATRGTGPLRPERGKITFAGNFRLADLCDTGRTLFWNAASFGEMEPAVVEHYASIAGSYAEWLFLHQCFTGKERAGADGHGVLEPVVDEHYERFFGCFTCTAREPAHIGVGYLVEGDCAYEDTFWHRRESPSS
jgi:putative sugar O-methyltransferase